MQEEENVEKRSKITLKKETMPTEKRETVKNKEYLPKLMWCRCRVTLPA